MTALIILNYNSYEDTVNCVNRLMSFDRDYRMIIVDNCSPDGSGNRLKEYYADKDFVDVISAARNGGYGAGNNTGIRHAREQYEVSTIGILNPDVEIPDADVIDSLDKILHSDSSYAVAGARIVNEDGSYNLNCSAWNIPSLKGLLSFQMLNSSRFKKKTNWQKISADLYAVDCVAGCFFLAKPEALFEIGLFDENMFLYFEETYIGIRLKEAGYREVIATDLTYRHNHHAPDNSRLTFKEKISVTKPAYDSAKYLCGKYYPRAGLILLWIVERYNRIILALSYLKYHMSPGRTKA